MLTSRRNAALLYFSHARSAPFMWCALSSTYLDRHRSRSVLNTTKILKQKKNIMRAQCTERGDLHQRLSLLQIWHSLGRRTLGFLEVRLAGFSQRTFQSTAQRNQKHSIDSVRIIQTTGLYLNVKRIDAREDLYSEREHATQLCAWI